MADMLKIFLTFCLVAAAATTAVSAQEQNLFGKIKLRADKLFDIVDSWGSYDTLHLEKLPHKLRLSASIIGTGTDLTINGINNSNSYKAELNADDKYTLNVSAQYRILSVSLSINPAKLFGKYKDFEIAFNAYGNRFGGDIVYQTANTFTGNVASNDVYQQINEGIAKQNLLILNGYWAVNGKKFSYPAALCQSWKQTKSCGSVMVGVSLLYQDLSIASGDTKMMSDMDVETCCVSIGCGYGYNFALRKNWLLHVSSLPEIVIYERKHTVINGARSRQSSDFPDTIVVGRLGACKSFSRYFAGMNAIVNVTSIGNDDELEINNVKWQAKFFVGIQL